MTATKTTAKKTATTKPAAKKAAPKRATKKALTYNVDGYAGLAATHRSQRTGTQCNIWFNAEAGKSTHGDTLLWTVECEDHGKSQAVATRREARKLRLDPTSFCSTCKAEAKKASRKAA